MKLKRKKIGDRDYNLIDTASGEVVANAVQTGEHGRDNYPWSWDMSDGRIFGRLDVSTGGSADSLKYVVDYVESLGESHGILKPVGEVDPFGIREGQVFRVTKRGIRYFYRATQDAYGAFNPDVLGNHAYIAANNHKGELTAVLVPNGDTVTLYTETGEAPQADRDAKREAAIAKAKEEDKAKEEARKAESALRKMVKKLDSRNKRTSRGYVTNRDELIAILSEVSKQVSVVIIEEERPYSVQHKEISVEIKLSLTLERDLL